MSRFFVIALLCFLIIACGENNTTQQPVSNDLVQLENDWMQAMMKRDQAQLDQLVAPEFTLSGTKYIDTPAVTRNMWIYNTMNDLNIDSVHFIKIKETRIKDVGIVKAHFYWSGTYDDDPFADSTYLVDTWVKKERGWQVVSRILLDQ